MQQHNNFFERDLFEIENANNLSPEELVNTFVPTKNFWRLLSSKNHIVLGSRGSGKTALAKMLSHDHLSKFNDSKAIEIIKSKTFIGIYVATNTEWVGGLKNKYWETAEEEQQFFQWRLNVSTCLALLITLKSCLDTYIDDDVSKVKKEREIIYDLSKSWSSGMNLCQSIRELRYYIKEIEFEKHLELTKKTIFNKPISDEAKLSSYSFDTDLFLLLKRGIAIISDKLDFPPDTIWLLCLDEAEFLEPRNLILINTYLRSHSENLFFKITTRPYFHYTLNTLNSLPLNVGHDFEYVYIDQDPILNKKLKYDEGYDFAEILFKKRAEASGAKYKGITLTKLLGESILLDKKKWDLNENSEDMKLLETYATIDTVKRAKKLVNQPTKFMNQIGRKIHGNLYLKHEVATKKGHTNLSVYSGVNMVIRCGDGNPRRLIRLFNSLLLQVNWEKLNLKKDTILSPVEQTKVLISFSSNTLTRTQSEEKVGPYLYEFLCHIGNYMHYHLHEVKISTDQVSSISIDNNISDDHWELITRASAIGLLFPNISISSPDQMPERKGTFHLAYVLSPHFKILPRRGSRRNLKTILDFTKNMNPDQMTIFDVLPRSE